ncbi:MAG: hypothetical protein QM533_13515, partial [Cytophagales bacterium]|nr:hypothetical protein [Cytophagales bacterium]
DMGTTVLIGGAISSAGIVGCGPSLGSAAANITSTPLGGLVRSLFLAVTASGSDNATISQAAAVIFPRLASPIPETFVSGTCSTMSSSGQPTTKTSLDLLGRGEVRMPEESQLLSNITMLTTPPAEEAESKDKKVPNSQPSGSR